MNIKEFSLMQKLIYCTSNNTIEQSFVEMAYYLLLNYNRIGSMSLKELTEKCYASPSQVRRFCQSIYYDNFSELREAKLNNTEDQAVISKSNFQLGRYRPYALYKEISRLMYRVGQLFPPAVLHQMAQPFFDTETTTIFAIRPYSTYLQEFQCQMIAIGKLVYIFEDIEPYQNLIQKAGDRNNVVVVSPTGGMLSALGSIIDRVPGEKSLIICEEFLTPEMEQKAKLFQHIYRLKLGTDDINYLELYGKYAIEYLFEMVLGEVLSISMPLSETKTV